MQSSLGIGLDDHHEIFSRDVGDPGRVRCHSGAQECTARVFERCCRGKTTGCTRGLRSRCAPQRRSQAVIPSARRLLFKTRRKLCLALLARPGNPCRCAGVVDESFAVDELLFRPRKPRPARPTNGIPAQE